MAPRRIKEDGRTPAVRRGKPACCPIPGRSYEVIAVDLDRAEAFASDVEVDAGLRRALLAVAGESQGARSVSLWGRTGAGLNAANEAVWTLFVFFVGPRVTGRLVADSCEVLNAEWPGCARLEGHGLPDGTEYPLAGLHAGRVVRYR